MGAVADIAWLICLFGTGLYELLPGFLAGLLAAVAAVAATLATKAPGKDVEALFDASVAAAGREEV